jgi:hypothetical protein
MIQKQKSFFTHKQQETMHNIFKVRTQSRPRRDMGQNIALAILFILMVLVFEARAQEGSQGNTTIFAGAQATVFGNYNFVTGGGGTQPGIVGTERTTSAIGTGFGVLNFSAPTLTVTGADDANHVDGYVRNLGAGLFVYPVGDNGFFGPFAATGAGTVGAYFHTDATNAVTSNLAGGNYPVLPATGPFPTTSKSMSLGTVSTVEYWDIDGTNASKISLTYDAGSAVGTLTGSSLNKLTIVGWDPATSQWVKIPSTVDVTSVLGGASNLTTGSITTNSTVIPNNFTVYTLGSMVPDLTPTLDINSLSFATDGTSRDFVVNLFEINNVDASGLIRFRITKLSAFTITFPLTSGTSDVFGGIANENGNWDFVENASFITVTAKTGINILAGGQAKIGFNITRKPNVPPGNAQNITPTIIGGSGGEINTTNNQVVTTVTAN